MLIATGTPLIIQVIYADGSKESFVHAGGAPSDVDNYTIPGTQYDSTGKATCPQNNNSSTGGTSGSGGGASLPIQGGGTCTKTVVTYPDGSTATDTDCGDGGG